MVAGQGAEGRRAFNDRLAHRRSTNVSATLVASLAFGAVVAFSPLAPGRDESESTSIWMRCITTITEWLTAIPGATVSLCITGVASAWTRALRRRESKAIGFLPRMGRRFGRFAFLQ